MQKRVLVVDDDSRIVRFLSLKLKAAGYEVTTGANGRDCLELVKSANPDLLLLDLMMPVMDGFEVLRRLGKCSELPVIVLTAKSDAFAEARNLGASEFFTKPFNPDELIEAVKKFAI